MSSPDISARGRDTEPRLEPGLYIVATPIGNLGDITRRAVEVLAACDIVACEDTRVAGKLMRHLGLSKRLWRHDDHTSAAARADLIAQMQGQAVALVSDAGTPLISDPGYRLVRETREAGLPVTTLPGPCAAVAALTMAGLPTDRFLFGGFLPAKDNARRQTLEELAGIRATLVFYESGPRLVRSLDAVAALWPDREVAVARELTKLHEECRTGPAAALARLYEAEPPRGEIVLLIGPPLIRQSSAADADALLGEALQTAKPSQAAAQVARETGLDRKTLYQRALELRQS